MTKRKNKNGSDKIIYFVICLLFRTWTQAESLESLLEVTTIRRSFNIDAKIDNIEVTPHAL